MQAVFQEVVFVSEYHFKLLAPFKREKRYLEGSILLFQTIY